MTLTQARVLTIIAESVFESKLVDLIERAGAPGYSIEEVGRGRGRHGSRAGTIESERIIKFFVVVPQHVADSILHELTRSFLPEHGVKVLLQNAEVMNWTTMPVG
jgi:hypothetical protein